MENLTVTRNKDQVYYSVYNSQGLVALYTQNREFALRIAREFQRNPGCTELVVGGPREDLLKRV